MQQKTQMGTYGGPDATHAVIPITTFRAQFGRDRLNNVLLETHKPEEMNGALKKFNEIMGPKFGYDPTDDRAFGTWDTVKGAKINRMITGGIQMFLGIVGALTLLIGGVGVANIMYAVVKERTREIGVKMALGAKARWIIWPFVLEALVYTFIGGALGIIIATLLVAAADVPADREQRGDVVPRTPDALAADRHRHVGDPRHDRPAGRLLPRAPRRAHRSRGDAALRMRDA